MREGPCSEGDQAAARRLMQAFGRFRRMDWHDAPEIAGKRADLALMFVIRRHREAGSPGMMVSEIGARLGVTSPTITQQIKGLEAEGLVRRLPDPHDRRAIRVSLTAEGERKVAAMERVMLATFGGLVEHLGEADSDKLAELLSRSAGYFRDRSHK
ncbi:MarR family transcriptional regulator [Paenibacillus sp. IB182496]|uniref:MarR family transcriptional regulator n=1 Tax=Paenibacillus sabuli TaxID=2772509 RepID=A0A927BWV0_9BACL|nr:MarR family transcriptional regulator [Paenibacillus sabuli]MBD2846924.1 MarR family transcriptional regulator [Paenibacillus sabuli]